jgi:hypothetical protein
MIKTVIKLVLVALLVFYVVTQPVSAAHTAHYLGSMLATAASGATTFVSNLA